MSASDPNSYLSNRTRNHTGNDGVYTGSQCQQLDLLAADALGIPTLELMQRAGAALLAEISSRYPDANQLIVCCGTGNNAGDGYVLARLALQQGWLVQVLQVDGRELTGDAGLVQVQAAQVGVTPAPWTEANQRLPETTPTTVIVDALLGTSVLTAPRPTTLSLMQAINAAADGARAVVAVDLPSGVNPEVGGLLCPDAVRADFTLTFLGRKLCLVSGVGAAYTGALGLATLGAPANVYQQLPGVPWRRFDPQALPKRASNTHKHRQGHVVVVGGDHGMGGAVAMTAEAALRVGAGMVTLVTREEHVAPILSRRPELMVLDAHNLARRRQAMTKADLVVVGPGLGRTGWGRALFAEVMEHSNRTLIDADGLSLLAAYIEDLKTGDDSPLLAGERVVTPHAGEAATLLGSTSGAVEADRQQAVLALAARTQGVALLKGPGTLIAQPGIAQPENAQPGTTSAAAPAPDMVAVCGQGNRAMATAGMGDVLAGVIAGLWAQGMPASEATVQGACWHAATADALVAQGHRNLLATQVLEALDSQATGPIR